MKHVTIRQPWASLICAGVIDSFDLGVDIGAEMCQVLVHAAKWQKYDNRKSIPLEWLQELEAATLTGIVPLYHEMPFDCVIGFVKASHQIDTYPWLNPIWQHGAKRETHYLLTGAQLFTKPLAGKLSENSELPSYCTILQPDPLAVEDRIVIPVNHKIFEEAREDYQIIVPLNKLFHEVIIDKAPKDGFKEVCLMCGFFFKKFAYEADNDFILAWDEKGKPKKFFSITSGKNEVKRSFKFHLRKQL